MSYVARNYSNGFPTTLAVEASASQTTFTIETPTGWPVAPYFAIVDRALPTQEVVWVTNVGAPSGGNVIITVTRNADGNGAYEHLTSPGGVELHAVAQDWTEFGNHRFNTAVDDHISLMRTDGTRHDLTARHSLGVTIPTSSPSTISLGAPAGAGGPLGLDRADHVHGRTETAGDLAPWYLPVGSIVPIDQSVVAYPNPISPWIAWCDGGWYPQIALPELAALEGFAGAYVPYTDLAPLSGMPSQFQALPQYQGTYNAFVDVALPCLMFWADNVAAPIWFLDLYGFPVNLAWAMVVKTPPTRLQFDS